MKCKEYLCNGKVPRGKGLESSTARLLGLCRYCYRMKVAPKRPKKDEPVKQDGERPLTPYEREMAERYQFEGMEALLWSPEFHKEWKDYLKDKWGH